MESKPRCGVILMLAMTAKITCTLAYDFSTDRFFALRAGCALAAIDLKLLIKVTGISIGVLKIP